MQSGEMNFSRLFALNEGFIVEGTPKTCADNEEGRKATHTQVRM